MSSREYMIWVYITIIIQVVSRFIPLLEFIFENQTENKSTIGEDTQLLYQALLILLFDVKVHLTCAISLLVVVLPKKRVVQRAAL